MIRFGLLGCGVHGERYLRHIVNDVPGAEAVALWRRDAGQAARLAAEYGVHACENLDELLAREDLDAFLVTTPPGTHAAELERLLSTGKAILVEKPLTGTLQEADALWRAYPQLPDARLMVAQTLRFNPTLLRAREEIARLGPLHRVRIQQRLEPTTIAWQQDEVLSGGGSVTLTGVHLFDTLRWMLGRTPDSVMARALVVEGAATTNLFDACFEYEAESLLCSTEISKFSNTRSCVLELVGRDAQLVVDYLAGTIDRIEGRERVRIAEPGNPPTLVGTLEAFCCTLQEGGRMPIDFLDGRETLRMAAAVRASNDAGRRVRLDEVAPADEPGPASD